MALPATVIITGEFFKAGPTGDSVLPDTGYVLFAFHDTLASATLNDIAGPFFFRVEIVDGKIEIPIPSTTDPLWTPTTGTYLVKVSTSTGVKVRRIVVPHDTPAGTVDLADIPDASISPQPDIYVYRREVGADGGVAPLGSDGLVPAEFLPESSGGGGGPVDWASVTGKPTTFPPSGHGHAVLDVSGLQAILDGKQAAGSYAAAGHTHQVLDVSGLQAILDGKQAAGSYAAAGHTHSIANVSGLQAALDSKQAAGSYAAAVHSHTITDTSGLQTALAAKHDSNRTLSTADAAKMLRTNLTYAVTISSPDYEQISINGTVICWRNENGFLRGMCRSDYKDDALVRGVQRSDLTNENGGYIELQNNARDQILHKRSWRTGDLWRGNGSAAAVRMTDSIVLGPTDPLPAGLPANVLIFRTA